MAKQEISRFRQSGDCVDIRGSWRTVFKLLKEKQNVKERIYTYFNHIKMYKTRDWNQAYESNPWRLMVKGYLRFCLLCFPNIKIGI